MTLPPGLITNRTSRLPGDLKKYPTAKGHVRPRHEKGTMNKREARHAADLEARKRNGEIVEWWFERVTFTLADKPEGTNMKGTRYTPDFMVLYPDGTIEFQEVKGFAEEDSIVKFKVASEQFNLFTWVWVK